jgi:hypothetical protein
MSQIHSVAKLNGEIQLITYDPLTKTTLEV